jgi:hypothetical protein
VQGRHPGTSFKDSDVKYRWCRFRAKGIVSPDLNYKKKIRKMCDVKSQKACEILLKFLNLHDLFIFCLFLCGISFNYALKVQSYHQVTGTAPHHDSCPFHSIWNRVPGRSLKTAPLITINGPGLSTTPY